MKAPVIVTDHALIRYLERVLGFDVAALRNAMTERLSEAARLGASAVTIDGNTYMIVGGVCTTVVKRKRRRMNYPSKHEDQA